MFVSYLHESNADHPTHATMVRSLKFGLNGKVLICILFSSSPEITFEGKVPSATKQGLITCILHEVLVVLSTVVYPGM